MGNMRIRRWPSLLLGVALLAVACSGGGPGSGPDGPQVDLDDPYQLPTMDFDGYRALLRDLRGSPVVVNIWAAWCGPCRAEAPGLSAAAKRYEGRVQFLGVDILDGREAARGFIREFGWTYPSLFDPPGEIRDRLGYFGQPVTLFYDARGELAFDWSGPIPDDVLDEQIRKLL
jgi:cytochrome c biogenesis protein CcmG, thiol:disulfide interchange protein DsbE